MPTADSQAFLREREKKLWTAADRLRANLDAAVYKHAVLGLIFLKYVSDSFAERQSEIEGMLKDPSHEFYLDPADYKKPGAYEEALQQKLEERVCYIEKNVFWGPALTRWKMVQDSAKLPPGSEFVEGYPLCRSYSLNGSAGRQTTYKITSSGKLTDDGQEASEKINPNEAERNSQPRRAARKVRAGARINRKGVLDRRYTQLQIDPASRGKRGRIHHKIARRASETARINPSSLIDLAIIPFQHPDLHSKDLLEHVYARKVAKQFSQRRTPMAMPYKACQSILDIYASAKGANKACPVMTKIKIYRLATTCGSPRNVNKQKGIF